MAKVTYDSKADDSAGLPENTTQFGYEFIGSKPVEVTNPAHLRKFDGHPHFKVSGDIPKDDSVRTSAERESAALGNGSRSTVTGQNKTLPTVAPVQPQAETGPAKVTPGQADKPDGDSGLRAVHRGGGVYAVMDGDGDEPIVNGLSKDEAEEFNDLSAAKKASFIKHRQ
jgi:hypothetical protein